MDSFELKPLTQSGIPNALEKARRYRLLNEPGNAESIYRDILRVDPEHQRGRIGLLLALTDQFGRGLAARFDEVLALAQAFEPYERAYYTGIACERRAKAHQRTGAPGSGQIAHDWFRRAMACFEDAEQQRPPDDDSAILRWNSCARRLMGQSDLRPEPEGHDHPPILGE